MKKRTKKLLDWFFETDLGEENVANCVNLYELVEKLQWRIESLENEHIQLVRKFGKLEAKFDILMQDSEE
jgi:hypothetical protein